MGTQGGGGKVPLLAHHVFGPHFSEIVQWILSISHWDKDCRMVVSGHSSIPQCSCNHCLAATCHASHASQRNSFVDILTICFFFFWYFAYLIAIHLFQIHKCSCVVVAQQVLCWVQIFLYCVKCSSYDKSLNFNARYILYQKYELFGTVSRMWRRNSFV